MIAWHPLPAPFHTRCPAVVCHAVGIFRSRMMPTGSGNGSKGRPAGIEKISPDERQFFTNP